MDNLKPLTIHLLLRYTEGIVFDRLKLGKASKISGDLRRSPEIVVSLRSSEMFRRSSESFGSVQVIFGKLRKYSGDLREHSEVFGRSSEGFVFILRYV